MSETRLGFPVNKNFRKKMFFIFFSAKNILARNFAKIISNPFSHFAGNPGKFQKKPCAYYTFFEMHNQTGQYDDTDQETFMLRFGEQNMI